MTFSTYIIRSPKNKTEWDAVKQLLIDYKNEFDDQTCFTSFEEEMDHIEEVYSNQDKFKLIAVEEPGGRIVGCVGLWKFSGGVAEMKRLYVMPAHRGLHLGKRLAEEIISIARDHHFQRIVLDTMHEMEGAQKLYQNLGFYVIPPYDDQDLAKLVCYEKKLD